MFHWFICVVIGSFVLSFAVKAHYAPHPTMLRPHRALSAPVHHITFLHYDLCLSRRHVATSGSTTPSVELRDPFNFQSREKRGMET